jgi:hypothetical protein
MTEQFTKTEILQRVLKAQQAIEDLIECNVEFFTTPPDGEQLLLRPLESYKLYCPGLYVKSDSCFVSLFDAETVIYMNPSPEQSFNYLGNHIPIKEEVEMLEQIKETCDKRCKLLKHNYPAIFGETSKDSVLELPPTPNLEDEDEF